MTSTRERNQRQNNGRKCRLNRTLIFLQVPLWIAFLTLLVLAQSGRNPSSGKRTTILHVIAQKVEDPNKPKTLLSKGSNLTENPERIIPKHLLELYDGGVLQKIEAFSPDPTPARFVVLLDNSSTLQTDVKKLASVPAAFAPEIYEGDKVMVIGYDIKPEVITDLTDDPKQIQNRLGLVRKTDQQRIIVAFHVIEEDSL